MANNSDNKKEGTANSDNSGVGTEKEKLTETIKKIISAGSPTEISKVSARSWGRLSRRKMMLH